MFKIKDIDISVFSEINNMYKLKIVETDNFPIDLEEYTLSGYIYEPYNEIDPLKLDLDFDGLNMTVGSESIANLDFKEVYKYKVFATKGNDVFLVQFGKLFVIDEMR